MNSIRHLFLLFVFLSLFKSAHSSHAVGGEITYQYLDSNRYLVKFVFYRDCIGITVPAQMLIDVTNSCGFTTQNIFLNLQSVESLPITCDPSLSVCNGGSYSGFERYTFSGIITLNGPCTRWTFSHTESARSMFVSTLSPNLNLFVYADLNNVNGNHSSPVFSKIPIPVICLGQNYCIQNLAQTNEGDVLTYQLIDPLSGPGTPVTYQMGYSATQPVIGSINFNTTNGELCLTPTSVDEGVYAVQVNQYRNGNLIGQIERDLIIDVRSCTNNLPQLSGFNGTTSHTINACTYYNNCYTLLSFDADAADSTFITTQDSVPFTITHNPGQNDRINICWSPTTADVTSGNRCFTLQVYDSHCPVRGYRTYNYCIQAEDSGSVFCRQLVGLKDPELISTFSISPNPASTFFSIQVDSYKEEHVLLRITDVFGKILYQRQVTDSRIEFNSFLKAGMFQVSIVSENGTILQLKKLIITN